MKKIKAKIEAILDNRLEAGKGLEGNKKEIENVKIWLCCEWQAGQIGTGEYVRLRDYIAIRANEKIANFKGGR